LKTGDIVVMED